MIHKISEDYWECDCGNATDTSGFFPCNEQGEEVQPTYQEWTTNEYICPECKARVKI